MIRWQNEDTRVRVISLLIAQKTSLKGFYNGTVPDRLPAMW